MLDMDTLLFEAFRILGWIGDDCFDFSINAFDFNTSLMRFIGGESFFLSFFW